MSVASETVKYQKAFKLDAYTKLSPGEVFWPIFEELAGDGESIVDIGCGVGRVGRLMDERGLKVRQVDLDDFREADNHSFTQAPIWGDWPGADYGYCCDVMEHIPTEWVMASLANIMSRVDQCFFLISLVPDVFGKQIGEPLHLTVKPFTWWLDRLEEVGKVTHARDCINSGVYWVCSE